MNNTMYFIRNRTIKHIERTLIKADFELRYKDRKERIFTNGEFLIDCKDKYISILVYDDKNKDKAIQIIQKINHKGNNK